LDDAIEQGRIFCNMLKANAWLGGKKKSNQTNSKGQQWLTSKQNKLAFWLNWAKI
jgi:hypothetical protein